MVSQDLGNAREFQTSIGIDVAIADALSTFPNLEKTAKTCTNSKTQHVLQLLVIIDMCLLSVTLNWLIIIKLINTFELLLK